MNFKKIADTSFKLDVVLYGLSFRKQIRAWGGSNIAS